MGLDIKRSDTPEFVQDFLEEILTDALSGSNEADVLAKIKEYKAYFKSLDPWGKGMPKRVNNLTIYANKMQEQARLNSSYQLVKFDEPKKGSGMVPGHVRASINYNNLRLAHGDQYSMPITDGMKVIVCRLKNNAMGYTSIAYPTDELKIPKWFKELPFDEEAMEEAVLDKKIDNVIGQMGWDLSNINASESLQKFFDF